MFIAFNSFVHTLLGIAFLCCKVFEIVKVGSSTLLAELSFWYAFYLVQDVHVADIRVAWLVYIYTYCVPIATLNQNKRSRLLYLGDMQTIINVLACGLVFSHLIGFFLQHNNSPEMFLAFPVFLVPL